MSYPIRFLVRTVALNELLTEIFGRWKCRVVSKNVSKLLTVRSLCVCRLPEVQGLTVW